MDLAAALQELAIALERALAAERARAWDSRQARGIDDLLELCASLRRLFGDVPPETRPWRGEDYRL